MRPGGKDEPGGTSGGEGELNEYSSDDDRRMGLMHGRRGRGSGTESEQSDDDDLMGPKMPPHHNHDSSGEMDDIELPPSIESNQSRSSGDDEEEDDIAKSLADAMAQQTLDRFFI